MTQAAFLHLLGDIWTHNLPLLKINAVGCLDLIENPIEVLDAVNKIPKLEVILSQTDELCEKLVELAMDHSATFPRSSTTISIASAIS